MKLVQFEIVIDSERERERLTLTTQATTSRPTPPTATEDRNHVKNN